MNTKTITTTYVTHQNIRRTPSTSRGRALYTIDWFLNGKPVLVDHDYPPLSIKNCRQ